MMAMDYQVDEVDAITGPAIGHPSSARSAPSTSSASTCSRT